MSDLLDSAPPPLETPSSGEHGYLRWKKPVVCSRDELIGRVGRGDLPLISRVWTPESPYIVSIGEVPFLQGAIRRQKVSELRFMFATCLVNGLLLAAMACFFRNLGALIFLGCLAVSALSLMSCSLTARIIRRLKSST